MAPLCVFLGSEGVHGGIRPVALLVYPTDIFGAKDGLGLWRYLLDACGELGRGREG